MHLPAHLAISWLMGHRLPNRRDRVIVAWAGVAPDLDALTALAGEEAYGRWHHVLTHGIVAAAVLTVLWTLLARDRGKVALLALAAFHGHLVCDLAGSGVQWSIQYLWPFSDRELVNPYGWNLNDWKNVVIMAAAITASVRLAVTRGVTFAEAFLPARAHAAVVETLRRRLAPGAAR